ncbi:NAD(P)H-dependent glycerol-3-phosphate dehydrogenase [Glycomyces buryatensis]|uniref:Glycerol-3-phosphate dehydrogenase [NAD(P)+] n=1 Tax=Glycomyces buryatensis TaxID=2570927 RepID=A0A4S8QAJ1_9ACTN|nr:NAD(P)H-dependent glycerol-3-phosphate dehydrogenase [Glycomyces buryatensis]THV39795.1 NAD(P)-dependent glycerol-3-phosphate dehydrogenase [Glycomyces buryatensis]
MGAGSWGTVFAKILADAGTPVTIWARRESVAATIEAEHRNPDYYPDVELPALVSATSDAAAALRGADLVVLSVPSQTLRENLAAWTEHLESDATLLSLMKGIELGTTERMTEVIAEVTGAPASRVAVLSGPNLAREIAEEQPTASVVACVDHGRAVDIQKAITTSYFRPYTNTDVVGCELGGAVKNVIALAYGMAAGMGMGDNTKATIITRGLAETTRLGMRLGADPVTFAGLAGLGDLVATCSSPLSRNHTFGVQLGLGSTLEEAAAVTKQTAEGVKSCRSITDLARKVAVEMPICDAVERVCHEGLDPRAAVAELMGRETKPETD